MKILNNHLHSSIWSCKWLFSYVSILYSVEGIVTMIIREQRERKFMMNKLVVGLVMFSLFLSGCQTDAPDTDEPVNEEPETSQEVPNDVEDTNDVVSLSKNFFEIIIKFP